MSAVENTSMISDVGLNIFQLRILLRVLQSKIGAKMFEPEHMIKVLSGNMTLPKFREHNYYHEAGSKPELILFWVRDIVAVYKKENNILIDYGDIHINKIKGIDIVVGGDNGQ